MFPTKIINYTQQLIINYTQITDRKCLGKQQICWQKSQLIYSMSPGAVTVAPALSPPQAFPLSFS